MFINLIFFHECFEVFADLIWTRVYFQATRSGPLQSPVTPASENPKSSAGSTGICIHVS